MTKPNGKRKGSHKSFAGIPRIVMTHPDYKSLGGNSIRLLLELAYQYRGSNNGDLQACYSLMKDRGFSSKETLSRAIKQLLEKKFIIRTRTGAFLNPGGRCALYALTWQPIDECGGKLEVAATRTAPRIFSLEKHQA